MTTVFNVTYCGTLVVVNALHPIINPAFGLLAVVTLFVLLTLFLLFAWPWLRQQIKPVLLTCLSSSLGVRSVLLIVFSCGVVRGTVGQNILFTSPQQ